MMPAGFGIVPSWNLSTDPVVNYHINPNVQFPPGIDQFTVQPVTFSVQDGTGSGALGASSLWSLVRDVARQQTGREIASRAYARRSNDGYNGLGMTLADATPWILGLGALATGLILVGRHLGKRRRR